MKHDPLARALGRAFPEALVATFAFPKCVECVELMAPYAPRLVWVRSVYDDVRWIARRASLHPANDYTAEFLAAMSGK